jgi:hypothetical protein
MYLLVMRHAEHPHGLPVQHTALPVDFTHPMRYLNTALWMGHGHELQKGSRERRLARTRLFVLTTLALVLCAICNLMGPATAVLVLPSLQWMPVPAYGSAWLTGMNSLAPPSTTGWTFHDASDDGYTRLLGRTVPGRKLHLNDQ